MESGTVQGQRLRMTRYCEPNFVEETVKKVFRMWSLEHNKKMPSKKQKTRRRRKTWREMNLAHPFPFRLQTAPNQKEPTYEAESQKGPPEDNDVCWAEASALSARGVWSPNIRCNMLQLKQFKIAWNRWHLRVCKKFNKKWKLMFDLKTST